jgi:hypothetical protein
MDAAAPGAGAGCMADIMPNFLQYFPLNSASALNSRDARGKI